MSCAPVVDEPVDALLTLGTRLFGTKGGLSMDAYALGIAPAGSVYVWECPPPSSNTGRAPGLKSEDIVWLWRGMADNGILAWP